MVMCNKIFAFIILATVTFTSCEDSKSDLSDTTISTVASSSEFGLYVNKIDEMTTLLMSEQADVQQAHQLLQVYERYEDIPTDKLDAVPGGNTYLRLNSEIVEALKDLDSKYEYDKLSDETRMNIMQIHRVQYNKVRTYEPPNIKQ